MPSTRPLHSTVSSPCPAHDHFTPQSAVHARHTTTLLHSQQSMPGTRPLHSTVSRHLLLIVHSPCRHRPLHSTISSPCPGTWPLHSTVSSPCLHTATSLHSQQASITDSQQSIPSTGHFTPWSAGILKKRKWSGLNYASHTSTFN